MNSNIRTLPPLSAKVVRSMTGFALVRRATGAGELTISLRAVNHRGLDLHFHLPSEFAPFENAMRSVLKQNVTRGHVEVRVSLVRTEGPRGASYNRDLIEHYVSAFRMAATDYQLVAEPDLNVAFTLPGVLTADSPDKPLDTSFEPEIVSALTECVGELNAVREREGASLVLELGREIDSIQEKTSKISQIRAGALREIHTRLTERLRELLSNSSIPQNRLAEEAALIADRSDVQEELTRLGVHSPELRRMLQEGGEVGKRIDFLLQEMSRETNTILSKTSGIGETGITVTNLALALKAHIEKIREQALNLE